MKQKKLMLLGGIRYLLPVIETARASDGCLRKGICVMSAFLNKKVLVLGGASVHCKLVNAAHNLGLHVTVADYLDDSPAKRIADQALLINIKDIDALEKYCRANNIEAVLSTHLDPGQRPYQQLCERLQLPCYGTEEMFYKMTDKIAFKAMCRSFGVPVIDEYSEKDVLEDRCKYPLFVKPVDSRGSRGQAVCASKDETIRAIEIAKKESSNGKFIIERFLKDAKEVQITYFFVNGEAYLIRTVDSYKGDEPGLEKVVSCAISPSVFTEEYLTTTHESVVKMFKALGMRNGPIFMQGFYDEGTFRFFDPGLRFPGVDYEEISKRIYNFDLLEKLWIFALTGKMPDDFDVPYDMWRIKGNKAAVLFPVMRAGRIDRLDGIEIINSMKSVHAYSIRHNVGETVGWTYDVNQRYAEVDVCEDCKESLINTIKKIQLSFVPYDSNNKSLSFAEFDTSRVMGD